MVPLLIVATVAAYLFLASVAEATKITFGFFIDQLEQKNVAEVVFGGRGGGPN